MLSVERGRPYRPSDPPRRRAEDPRPHLDAAAIVAVSVLVALGLMNLHALGADALADRQVIAVTAGVALFLVLSRFRAASLIWLGWTCYGASVVLLLAVEVLGSSAYGARRWLGFGSFTVQPSELAKIGLVLVLARVLASGRTWWQRLILALTVAALPIGLVVMEPDLSTATVLTALTLAMLVIGKLPFRGILVIFMAVALLAPIGESLLHPYQVERLQTFLSGGGDAQDEGWTILQSHIALGWGGLTGRSQDPMHGLLAQYLPARETDLAFSSLVEQWGLLAGITVVAAAAIVVWRTAAAGRNARTVAAGYAAAGFATLISIEVLVSVASNVGLLPTAGVPLPIVSFGGSAAAAHIAALGIVLGLRVDATRRPLWLATRRRRIHPRLLRFMTVVVTAQLLGLAVYAWQYQQTRGPALRRIGLTQMTRCDRIPAPRGVITDRHGKPLAENRTEQQVMVVPSVLAQADRQRVAALVGKSDDAVERLLAARHASIAVSLGPVPAQTAARVKAAHLPGVLVIATARRHYESTALLGPLLGWTGVATPVEMKLWPDVALGEIVGRAGVEQQYDPILRGIDGSLCVYVDPFGEPVAMGPITQPVPGSPLRLSIDLGLQKMLTSSLATAMTATAEHSGGSLGAAAVMDPRNGQMLAMASLPSYDNNVYGPPLNGNALERIANTAGSPMLEHLTQVVAPPGSTFKLVVASADVVHQAVPPDLVVETGGAWSLGGHVFNNWGWLPPQNLVQAIAWSNDVYFYKLAWTLGADAMIDIARQYGVGRPTGIDLPGESSGYLGTPDTVQKIGATWYPGSTVLLGIGQGYVNVTPLQDLVWTAAASTGAVATPHIGLSFGASDGSFSALTWPGPRRLPFASKLRPVQDGMRAVATDGTALLLQNLPVPAGGKTGTAEDPSAGGEGLDSWLSAVAPFEPSSGVHPRVAATAFIRGQGEGHPSSEVVRQALAYFFAHEKAILATPR